MSASLASPSTLRRVIILGHSGFIGGNLEKIFRQQSPNLEVVGRSLPTLDLTKTADTFSLAPLFDLETAVIVCSAVKRQLGDHLDAFRQNLAMVTNLCRLLDQHPVKRLLYMSSAAVYGEDIHNPQITELTPVCPTSYYGIAKFTSERLFAKQLAPQPESSLLCLRPATIYGPGDSGSAYSPSGFARAALQREKIILWGDGEELREFLYIDDVVKLIYQLTFHSYDGVLNVVSGKSYSFSKILEILAGLLNANLQIGSRPRTKAKVDNAFDNSGLMALFPAFNFTDLQTGVRQTLDHQKTLLQNLMSEGEEG